MGAIGKVSAGITMSSGAGGIITASTVALFPVTIALEGCDVWYFIISINKIT